VVTGNESRRPTSAGGLSRPLPVSNRLPLSTADPRPLQRIPYLSARQPTQPQNTPVAVCIQPTASPIKE